MQLQGKASLQWQEQHLIVSVRKKYLIWQYSLSDTIPAHGAGWLPKGRTISLSSTWQPYFNY
uniref:Uncharacterized protein n=1 Tax=Ciona intestinalis TaxID=7719 RepID=H2XMU5_CIOIN